jgi:hypothetical protein
VPLRSPNLNFKRYTTWSFSLFSESRWVNIIRLVHISRIVGHYCFNFLFIRLSQKCFACVLSVISTFIITYICICSWRKSHSSKSTLLLDWSHHCKKYTVFISIFEPIFDWEYEIYISQITMDLLLSMEICSILYHCQDVHQSWLYIWIILRMSYK